MKRLFAVIFLLNAFCITAQASPGKKKPYPKIGLVLSGGGARGATHVGVLKVLEEMRVPVYCITGTSMGSAVGGLYAAGIPAKELEKIFLEFDWVASFTDSPSRRELSFRRKEDDRTFLVKTRIGIGKNGFKLPRGLVEGQNFTTEIRKLAHVVESLDSFDQLPIPFRAMATDLGSGKAVVLDHGDLVKAIRASIAVSPLFTPIEIDGHLLADGGYLRNIPIEVAQEMGADRLIVVNIGTPLSKAEEINSVLAVSGQVARLGGTFQDRLQISKMAPTDIFLQPDLGDLSFTDFDKIAEFIRLGEKAARAIAPKLAALSLSKEEYQAWRNSLAKPPSLPRVDAIEIRNQTLISDRTLTPFLRQALGKPVDPAQMQTDLARLYGLGYFESLDYHIERRKNKNILIVDAPKKSWGPNYLRLGFQTAEDFDGQSNYGILTSYQMTELNSLGGEFRVDGIIGTNSGAKAEFYQPVGRVPTFLSYGAPYFTYTNAFYGQEHDPILIDKTSELPFKRTLGGAGAGGGRTLGNWGQAKLGLNWWHETWKTPTVPTFQYDRFQGEITGQILIDTLDKPGFPRKGTTSRIQYRNATKALGSDASASTVDANLGLAQSWNKHTVRLRGDYATNLQEHSSEPYIYRLGGFLNLSGFGINNLVGLHKILGQGQYLYRVGQLAKLPWYMGTAAEWGGVWDTRSAISEKSGNWAGSVFTALDTGLGPVYFAYSKAEGKFYSVYLYIGHAL